MKKTTFLKTILLATATLVGSVNVLGQGLLSEPVFAEDFEAFADGTDITTSNSNFSHARVSTGSTDNYVTNQIKTKNPGSFAGGSVVLGAKSTSITTIDKTGLNPFTSGTFTLKTKIPATTPTSSTLFCAVGHGSNFGSNSTFTGAQMTTAIQVYGDTLRVRDGGSWVSAMGLAASTGYEITVVFNVSGSTLTYGESESLSNNKCHLWVDGIKINEYNVTTNGLAATSFRAYVQTSEFEIDDIAVYNTLPRSASATCIASTLSFETNTITKLATDENYTLTATSLNEATAIIYSSLNGEVATVNETTGEVTIIGSGKTMIIAAQVEGVHNEVEYCAGEVSYELIINPAPKTFELVTSTSALEAGVNYLVVGVDTVTDLFYALGAQNTNNRAAVLIEPGDNEIIASTAYSTASTWLPSELRLGGNVSAWTLYDPIQEKMLGPDKSTNANNHLKPSEATPIWTIEINEDYEATIVCFGGEANTNANSRNSLRFNRSNQLFSCYASGGQLPVYLYKELTEGSGISSNKNDDFKPYVLSGRIYFNALEGKTIEIYNAMGQRLYQGTTTSGLNSIAVDKGIVLVKIGNSINKLIVK